RTKIHRLRRRGRSRTAFVDCWRPRTSLEMIEDSVRDEPSSWSIHVPVPITPLLMRKEPLRNDYVQIILSPCHGDVEETALFLDLRYASGRQIRWDATIDTVQDEYRFPRLAFC